MKRDRLKKLNQGITRCKKCDLWKTRKNTVSGEGPGRAKIMIIGQAPGREEDCSGKPFIGRAGKLLDKLLDLAEIKRKNVFITSPIKCFPPKNRKPTKNEIESCLPYLKKQIQIINPHKFILLGGVAFKIFFPDEKLKNLRGKWIKKDRKLYFPTYHPAAGLRFPKIRTYLRRDFARLRQNLECSA